MLLPAAFARMLVGMIAAVAVSLAVSANTSAAEPSDVPSVALAEIPAEQVTGWSEPAEADGKKVRTVQAGQDAVLQVQPWWRGSLRPAEGQYWQIEVQYKDTAKQPIIFSVFANLARQQVRTELHRFGGFGDGKWKTARIPLGWDMMMVRPATKMVEFGFHSSEGDVPVTAVRVTVLPKEKLAEAAERYNEESRQWLSRIQTPKRNDLAVRKEMGNPQQPDPAAVKGKQAVVPYVRNYLDVVYLHSAPQKGETDKPLEATMAMNEYEPAAFGVFANEKALTNVRVRVEGLKHESDPKATLTSEVRTAEYSLQQSQPRQQKQKLYAMSPLRLWPMFPAKIAEGKSRWFWLTFRSDPAASKPGLYTGKAIITADQGEATLDVRVRVLPITLVDMNDTDLRMGGCVQGMTPRHEMEEMLRHNHNQLNLWLAGVHPDIKAKGKDEFELDFTLMDDFMAQMKAAGLKANVYFLGGNPYRFPGSMTLPKLLATEVLGMTEEQFVELQKEDKDNIPPQIVPLYKKWVGKFIAHAKAKGWPEQVLTPFDEPAKWNQNRAGTGPWIKPQFIQGCKLIREASPDTRIYISAHHPKASLPFLQGIDVFCTNVAENDKALAPTVLEAGKTLWQYSNANKGLPDQARFTYGFHYNAYNSRGSLCWAYNWFINRFDITPDQSCGYAWVTPLDVIPGPYYEALREAWDDRRYVETLKKVASERGVKIQEFLAGIDEQAHRLRGKGGTDAVDDFWQQAREIERMDLLRRQVANKILEVQAGRSAASRQAG